MVRYGVRFGQRGVRQKGYAWQVTFERLKGDLNSDEQVRIPCPSHGGLRAWESGAPILIGRVLRPVHRGVDAASFSALTSNWHGAGGRGRGHCKPPRRPPGRSQGTCQRSCDPWCPRPYSAGACWTAASTGPHCRSCLRAAGAASPEGPQGALHCR
jgi:hypothetical protein